MHPIDDICFLGYLTLTIKFSRVNLKGEKKCIVMYHYPINLSFPSNSVVRCAVNITNFVYPQKKQVKMNEHVTSHVVISLDIIDLTCLKYILNSTIFHDICNY